jgi:biopolymer transport protein ExbD
MKRRPTNTAIHSCGHINVTPMIDVVMCLIIFFLLVGRLVLDRRGEIDLPQTRSGESIREISDPLIITVEAAGELRLDGRPMSVSALTDQLALDLALSPERRVRLRADRDAAYAVVRPVIHACREAGAHAIELAAEPNP